MEQIFHWLLQINASASNVWIRNTTYKCIQLVKQTKTFQRKSRPLCTYVIVLGLTSYHVHSSIVQHIQTCVIECKISQIQHSQRTNRVHQEFKFITQLYYKSTLTESNRKNKASIATKQAKSQSMAMLERRQNQLVLAAIIEVIVKLINVCTYTMQMCNPCQSLSIAQESLQQNIIEFYICDWFTSMLSLHNVFLRLVITGSK